VVCGFLLPAPLSAQNRQRVLPIDSEVYQAIKSLYIARGLALPSTTGPWSEAELLLMLGRVDAEGLSAGERALYDFAQERLAPQGGFFNFDLDVNLEARAHTNPDDFTDPDDYLRNINLLKPLLDPRFEFFITDYAYGFLDVPVGARIYYALEEEEDGTHIVSQQIGKNAFALNIPMLSGGADIDFSVPYRTFAAVGASGWNLVVGRDRLSWGPGYTGNFVVGDQVHYHTNGRLSFWGDHFKYTYSISNFSYPAEYYNGWDSEDYNAAIAYDATRDGGSPRKGLSLFIAHRLEARVWKLNFALTEAVMYENKSGVISLAEILPNMILHNLYMAENQNSTLALELDYSPLPRLNIYGQVVMDDFTTPGAESGATAEKSSRPDAMGFMLGLQTVLPTAAGVFSAFFEAAYTQPFLYLMHEKDGSNSNSYIVANRYYNGQGTTDFAEEFLGYRWGGDALVFALGGAFAKPGAGRLEGRLLFVAHGTYDKWTAYTPWYAAGSSNYPQEAFLTETHRGAANYADPDAETRNAIRYLTGLSVAGSLNLGSLPNMPPFLRDLTLYGQADILYLVNPGNISGARPIADVQLVLGVSYRAF
jgi:hypothetical protein